jgi:hypothetical protein
MKHSCRICRLDGSSRRRDQVLHVDIRDEAFVPNPLVSMAYRATATRSCTLNIRDRASVPDLSASMTDRVIRGSLHHVDICDRASVLK